LFLEIFQAKSVKNLHGAVEKISKGSSPMQLETAQIAKRMVCAVEAANPDSLNAELCRAERFAAEEEERLELLGAIAHDIRDTLARSQSSDLSEALGPHLELLRHLAAGQAWVN
jgi:hypothetical protein